MARTLAAGRLTRVKVPLSSYLGRSLVVIPAAQLDYQIKLQREHDSKYGYVKLKDQGSKAWKSRGRPSMPRDFLAPAQ